MCLATIGLYSKIVLMFLKEFVGFHRTLRFWVYGIRNKTAKSHILTYCDGEISACSDLRRYFHYIRWSLESSHVDYST